MDGEFDIDIKGANYRAPLAGWPILLKLLLAVAWTAGICAIPFATDPQIVEKAAGFFR